MCLILTACVRALLAETSIVSVLYPRVSMDKCRQCAVVSVLYPRVSTDNRIQIKGGHDVGAMHKPRITLADIILNCDVQYVIEAIAV
jgi:hypothetical protein